MFRATAWTRRTSERLAGSRARSRDPRHRRPPRRPRCGQQGQADRRRIDRRELESAFEAEGFVPTRPRRVRVPGKLPRTKRTSNERSAKCCSGPLAHSSAKAEQSSRRRKSGVPTGTRTTWAPIVEGCLEACRFTAARRAARAPRASRAARRGLHSSGARGRTRRAGALDAARLTLAASDGPSPAVGRLTAQKFSRTERSLKRRA